VIVVWFSWLAKPLGGMPYRWGTFLGVSHGLYAVAFLFIAVLNVARPDSYPFGPLPWFATAIAYAVVSIGLLMRRKFGVNAFYFVQVLFGVLGTMAIWALNGPIGALFQLVLVIVNLVASFYYFAKRVQFMGERDRNSLPLQEVTTQTALVEPRNSADGQQ
jgi:hypothetical protein